MTKVSLDSGTIGKKFYWVTQEDVDDFISAEIRTPVMPAEAFGTWTRKM